MFFEQQHGFHPRMSCVIQLLYAVDHWTKDLDNGNDVDIIYLDFLRTSAYYPSPMALPVLS